MDSIDQPSRGEFMLFQVGDKAVHPAHGVGTILSIESRVISGEEQAFYIVEVESSRLKIMVPTGIDCSSGLRKISNLNKIKIVFGILKK